MASNVKMSESDIREMLAIADQLGESELATRTAMRGGNIKDFYRALMDRQQILTGDDLLGLTRQDVQGFSITRLARASANFRPEEARHEKDLSALLTSKTGMVGHGDLIPFSVLARDFNAGTAGESGNLIGAGRTGNEVGDPLRKVFSLAGLGATFLTGLRSTTTYPVFIQAADAAHLTETGTATTLTETTRAVTLTPRRLAFTFVMSRQANLQSDAELDKAVLRQMRAGIDEGMLRGILAGDGTGQNPTGILFDSNVNIEVGGATGATLTFQHLVDMENAPAAANIPAGTGAWVINSATAKYLRTKAAGTNLNYIYGNDNRILGSQVMVNNLLPANLTKSSGTNLSGLIYSNSWQDLIVGIYGPGFDMTVDPVTLASDGKIRVVVSLMYGFGLRQPGAFSVMKDAALV
jgi:HK97 family phage major capsid protein